MQLIRPLGLALDELEVVVVEDLGRHVEEPAVRERERVGRAARPRATELVGAAPRRGGAVERDTSGARLAPPQHL